MSTCQFVPPYLLQRIAAVADDEDLCGCGRRTLQVDDQVRGRRAQPPSTLRPPELAEAEESTGATRAIHSADNSETLPGRLVRRDGDEPSGDVAVDEAYASSGQAWDLFADLFDRQSVDGQGTPLSVTVHYGQRYDNAFWDGRQLVFGDGDGTIFERFTKPMDVMVHEFTHGVTQFTAALTYQGQSGALNESVSDVFASMAKQRVLEQTSADADWLIGEGLFMPDVKATALRSMKAPGTAYDDPRLGRDPQVGSMDDYDDTPEDNGGVHINSGIPNRAFHLAAVALGGNSWERAGRIWYDALTAGEVTADTDFVGFAEATEASARRLFGDDASVVDQIRAAWAEVGVLPPSAGPLPAGPPPAGTSNPEPATNRIAVRRSGGFAGTVRAADLDLATDPLGPEVRSLLDRVDLRGLAAGHAGQAPDRFVYTVEYGGTSTTLSETELSPELHQVVRLVLGDL